MIGEYMEFALKRDAELVELSGGRIWPVIAPEEMEGAYPYVIYAMDGMEEASTKDGIYGDTVREEILVCGRSVAEVENVADAVRRAMERALPAWNDESDERPFLVQDQTFRAGAEDFDLNHDGFFLPLNYVIETER